MINKNKILVLVLSTHKILIGGAITLEPIIVSGKQKQHASLTRTLKPTLDFTLNGVMQNHNPIIISQQGAGFETITYRGITQDNMQLWVDGMPFLGGASPVFNLAQMRLFQDQNISIESGTHSARYGGNTFLGRLMVETPYTQANPQATTYIDAGRYNTFRKGLSLSGHKGASSGTIQYARAVSNGRVTFAKHLHTHPVLTQGDMYKQHMSASRFDHESHDITFRLYLRSGHIHSSYKTLPTPGFDDVLDYRANETFTLIRGVVCKKNHFWEPTFGIGQANFKRQDYSPETPVYDNKSHATMTYINWDNLFKITNKHQFHINAAMMIQQYSGLSSFGMQRAKNHDYFLNLGHQYNFDQTQIDMWIGINQQKKQAKPHLNFTLKHIFSDTLKGILSVGSASKQPTLFQLYDPYAGNAHLSQEKAYGTDAVWIYENKAYMLKQQYFLYKITEKIASNTTPDGRIRYQNQDRSCIWGMETSAAYTFGLWTFSFDHLYNHSTDTQKKRINRIPMHKITTAVKLHYPNNCGHIQLSVQHMGTMTDKSMITQTHVKLPKITTFHLESTYTLDPNIWIYGHMDNILNKKYEFPLGYQSGGFSITAGIRIKM